MKRMLRVIQIVHCLIFLVSFGFTSGEVEYMSYSTNFINATLICTQNGGHLASVEGLTTTYLNRTESVWTPYVFVRTPFIASKGCFKDLGSNSTFNVGKGNSTVAKCFVYCYPLKSFALSGDFCSCLPSDMKCSEDEAVNASLCDGNNVNNIYKRVYEVLSDPVNVQGDDEEGDVYKFYKCRYRGGSPRISPTSLGESLVKEAATAAHFYPICKSRKNGEVVSENTAYKSWNDAEEACIRRNEKYMSYNLHTGHCQQLSKYVNNLYLKASFWCDERTYSAVISYEDLIEANIPWRNIKCKVAEFPNNLKYVSCDSKEYKFACETGKEHASNKHGAADDAAPEVKTIIVGLVVCLLACGIIICVIIFYIKKLNYQMKQKKTRNKHSQARTVCLDFFTQCVLLLLNFLRKDKGDVQPSTKEVNNVDLECGDAKLRDSESLNQTNGVEEKQLGVKGKDSELSDTRPSVTEESEPFLTASGTTITREENDEDIELLTTYQTDDRRAAQGKGMREVALLEPDNTDKAEQVYSEAELSCSSAHDTTSNIIDQSLVDLRETKMACVQISMFLDKSPRKPRLQKT